MKVLLVNPPRNHNVLNTGVKLAHSVPKSLPPINLLYIAGPLVQDERHHVEILDGVIAESTPAEICEYVREGGFDVVGFPLYTLLLREVKTLCRGIRAACPDIHICLGGPHVGLYPTETLSWTEIDTIILGYAEHAFHELVNALEDGAPIDGIPGVGYVADGEPRIHPAPKLSGGYRLDFDIPYHLIPSDLYASALCRTKKTALVVTSRGCPYSCHFCTNSTVDAFAFRDLDCVIRELRALREAGFREFMFFDETFNLGKKRVIEICKAMLESGLDLRWSARVTVKPLTEEMVSYMKRAGCTRLHIGIESGSDRILDLMNKRGQTVEDCRQSVRVVHDHGIEIVGYFLLGYPDETIDEIEQTVEFSKSLPIEFAQYSVFTPMPGTVDYFKGIARGAYPDFYSAYAKDPIENDDVFFDDEDIPRASKIELIERAYKEFYFSPRRFLLILRTMRSYYRVLRFGEALLNVVLRKGFSFGRSEESGAGKRGVLVGDADFLGEHS